MPYLMMGYVAAVLLLFAGCRVSAWTVPGLPGVRLLSWACISGLVGLVLMALRPVVPLWMAVVVANDGLFVWSLLLYCATADTLAVRPRFLPWGIGLIAAASFGLWYLAYIQPSLLARILICSGVPAILAAATTLLFLQRGELSAEPITTTRPFNVPTLSLAVLQILICVQHLMRNAFSILRPPSEILHLDLVQASYTYSNMILNASAAAGVIWLALCTQRNLLHARADTDGLTGLLNRRAFEEILAGEVKQANQASASFTILLADIDRFKEINDGWGHAAGDYAIRRVSSVLREGIRPGDVLSRFGGEEFVILLHDTSLKHAHEIAERLRSDVASLSGFPGAPVTISIGVAANCPSDAPEWIMRRSDEALYCSKRGGRNLVTIYEEDCLSSPLAAQAN